MSSDTIALLKSFLKSDPNDGFTRFALAMELRKSGDLAGSESEYRGLLALDPGYVGAYYHLGKLLEETGRAEDAKKMYADGIEKAVEARDLHAASELRQALEEVD